MAELRHRGPDGDGVLATRIDTADSRLTQGLGLMFRRSIPDDYALVFRFDDAATRRLHMFCVRFDVDAVWLRDGRVERTKRLAAWRGYGSAVADAVVELPAGAAADVDAGDEVWLA